jgi:hypothetical protein
MRFVREALALAALALQIGAVWFFWSRLPAQVPKNYGFGGRPDDYGDKSLMVVFLAIAIFLYGLLTILSFFPQGFNYPVAVTDKNRDKLQAMAVDLLGWIKAEITWLFLYIAWTDIQVGRGLSGGLGWAFTPVLLAVLGVTITAGIVRMRRAG